MKNSMKTKIISFILGSLFTIAALYIFASFLPSTQQGAANITSAAVNPDSTVVNPIKEPTLSLPLSYFHQEDLQGGFVSPELDSDDFTTWGKAQFDSGYRSQPTTTITFIDFRNTDEALPELPDEENLFGLCVAARRGRL